MSECARKGRSLMLMMGALLILPLSSRGQTDEVARELTKKSGIVAVGTVTAVQSEWTSNRGAIVTHVRVSVDQYLKGDPGTTTLVITVPGGEIDGVGEVYTHTATFLPNEEVVVFAHRDMQGNVRVTGGESGKLLITRDAVTGRRLFDLNRPLEVLLTTVSAAAKAEQQE